MNKKIRNMLLVGTLALSIGAGTILVNAEQILQKAKESTVVKNEEVTFLLDFQVGNTEKIDSLVIMDQLENVLSLKAAKVLDKDKKDITNQGKLELDKTNEKVTWTANEPAKYFGQTIYLEVKAALKPNVDLDKYYNKETDRIEIPNVGKMIVNKDEVPTDKVVIVPPPSVKPAMSKKIEKNGKEVDFSSIKFDEDIVYTNTAQVPTNRKLTKVELYDALEKVLVYKSAKVMDKDKKDITDQGKLVHDEKTNVVSWTANKPEDMDGKILKLQITAQVKNVPELAEYLKDGKIVIPNKAVLKINEEDTPSPEVTVTPPTIKNKAEKFVSKEKVSKPDEKDKGEEKTEETTSTEEASTDSSETKSLIKK